MTALADRLVREAGVDDRCTAPAVLLRDQQTGEPLCGERLPYGRVPRPGLVPLGGAGSDDVRRPAGHALAEGLLFRGDREVHSRGSSPVARVPPPRYGFTRVARQ